MSDTYRLASKMWLKTSGTVTGMIFPINPNMIETAKTAARVNAPIMPISLAALVTAFRPSREILMS